MINIDELETSVTTMARKFSTLSEENESVRTKVLLLQNEVYRLQKELIGMYVPKKHIGHYLPERTSDERSHIH